LKRGGTKFTERLRIWDKRHEPRLLSFQAIHDEAKIICGDVIQRALVFLLEGYRRYARRRSWARGQKFRQDLAVNNETDSRVRQADDSLFSLLPEFEATCRCGGVATPFRGAKTSSDSAVGQARVN